MKSVMQTGPVLIGGTLQSLQSDEATCALLVDLTETDVTASQLASRLESLPKVRSVEFQESSSGLVSDRFHFPLTWDGQRAIVLLSDVMGSIIARIHAIFGSGPTAEVLLYQLGEAAGSAEIARLRTIMGQGTILAELPQLFDNLSASGWGVFRIRLVDFDKKAAILRVFENFECMYYAGKSLKMRGHFVRGLLAGRFTEVFGRKVEATETACIAQGRGDFCEFQIKPTVKENLRRVQDNLLLPIPELLTLTGSRVASSVRSLAKVQL